MKRTALFLIVVLSAQAMIFAEDEKTGVELSSELFMQISSLPEAKIGFTQNFRFPFLQGKSPLTSGNNINLALTAEVTPISLNGIFNVVWTPIAFVEIDAGIRLGAGWPIKLFGNDLYGTGLNLASGYDGRAFDALLWKAHFGAAFQFDLAAVVSGDWNSVIFRTYHEVNYHGNTRAGRHQAWYYENDDGENMNGFIYYGNIVLGYQMPIFLNMIGIMAEMDLYLYDTPGRELWGDNLIRWHLSAILNFQVTEKFSIAVITQFRTRRNFTDATRDLHYQSRIMDPSQISQSFKFYRVAGILTYKF